MSLPALILSAHIPSALMTPVEMGLPAHIAEVLSVAVDPASAPLFTSHERLALQKYSDVLGFSPSSE